MRQTGWGISLRPNSLAAAGSHSPVLYQGMRPLGAAAVVNGRLQPAQRFYDCAARTLCVTGGTKSGNRYRNHAYRFVPCRFMFERGSGNLTSLVTFLRTYCKSGTHQGERENDFWFKGLDCRRARAAGHTKTTSRTRTGTRRIRSACLAPCRRAAHVHVRRGARGRPFYSSCL